MRLGICVTLFTAMAILLANPASAKQYFFCYYWAGPSYENRTTVALTKIMEADVERIDDYRLERAWADYAIPGYMSNSPMPGIRDASNSGQSGFQGGCLTSQRRAYLEEQIARFYQPTYRYDPVEWTAVPADIVPAVRASEGNVVEIAVPSGAPIAKPAPDPARSRAQLVDTPSGKILMTPEKKAEYEAKLAQHKRQLAERERIIAEAAAKHAANKAAAEAKQAQHGQELAQHHETVAQMERDAAAKRAEWAMRAAGQDPKNEEDELVEFKEGVVLCQQPSPSSRSFNCQGPLQNISTPLDEARTQIALGQACGSDRSIRDLGMVKGYRAFGCGFGIHPTARDYPGNADVPARLGIDFIPGRGSYFCPKSKLAYCR